MVGRRTNSFCVLSDLEREVGKRRNRCDCGDEFADAPEILDCHLRPPMYRPLRGVAQAASGR